MAKKILWSGSTVLPSPVSISVNDQIIWSANTGRSASGSMIGDVVARKERHSYKVGHSYGNRACSYKKDYGCRLFSYLFS